jgi:hypothetical protein
MEGVVFIGPARRRVKVLDSTIFYRSHYLPMFLLFPMMKIGNFGMGWILRTLKQVDL